MDKVYFPGNFIAVPYASFQNQPSKPLEKLVHAKSQEDLEVQMKKLFYKYVLGGSRRKGQFIQLDPEDGFGDFVYTTIDGDVSLYLTLVEEEPKKHLVMITGEHVPWLCVMSTEQLDKAKKLIAAGLKREEYPEKLNDIIDATLVKPGEAIPSVIVSSDTIDTSGDGWGLIKDGMKDSE